MIGTILLEAVKIFRLHAAVSSPTKYSLHWEELTMPSELLRIDSKT